MPSDRRLFDASPDPQLLVDTEQAVVRDANRALCALLGVEREAIVGEPVGELTGTAVSREALLAAAARAGPDDRETVEVYLDGADGTVAVEGNLAAVPEGDDAAGRLVVASLRDVSEYVDDDDPETYRRRLDGAMFAGELAWWELDVDTGQVTFHENRARMLGYDPGRFEEWDDFVAVVHPDDRDRMRSALRDHLAGEADRYAAEYRVETAGGGERWFSDVGGITEWAAEGRPLTVTGVVVDVTRRKVAEEHLRERAEQLAVLNRLLRHDIRNDMSVVTGWLDVVREAVPPDAREHLDRVVEASEHTLELTGAVGDLTAVVVEGESLETEATDLADALLGSVERARASYGHATIAVGEVPAVAVRANPLLSSVFDNLLNNAVQHHDGDHPEIEVRAERDGERVRVTVADDGPGIPEERRERMFDRGERSLESEGSGLGLYLVDVLVDAYGGAARVGESDLGGTAVTVELPVAGEADQTDDTPETRGVRGTDVDV